MRISRKRSAPATAAFEVVEPAPPAQPRLVPCGEATLLIDAITAGAPGTVLEELVGAVCELAKPTLARPETLLVPLAAAVAPEVTSALAHPRADVLHLASGAAMQSPAITAVHDQRALDLPADGATAVLVVDCDQSATHEELRHQARLIATVLAGIAPSGGAPFKRVVLAVAVALEGVEKLTGAAPEINFGFDLPLAQRPHHIGRALGALLAREDDDGPLERVRVVLAERHTGGLPTAEGADLVAAMAAGARQRGGAHVDVDGVTYDDDSLFIPVVDADAGAAERTAELLAPYLTGVGRLTLGFELRVD